MVQTADELMPDPPPAIPDHTLLHLIGRGSYGEVWLARNVMGTARAVKIVRRNSFDHARPYEREFEGIRKCEPVSRTHEGLVDVLHIGREEAAGFFYYVMELADSAEPAGLCQEEKEKAAYRPLTLSVRLREGALPVEDCLVLAQSLAGALAHLHEHGLIHRDVKPSNILYVDGQPRLGDIGLVAEAGASRSFVGTEGYVPLEGPGSVKADLFALGRVLYEALTGLDRTRYPELPDKWAEAYDFDQRLELNEIVLRACEDDPERRYRNARELLADAAAVAGGRSLQRMRQQERRLRVARSTGMIAAIVALLTTGGFIVARRQASQERLLRERAEQAERVATDARWEALCAQTRAARRDIAAGAVTAALAAAEEAAAFRVSPELRSDAAFLLARPDLTPLDIPALALPNGSATTFLDLARRRWLQFPAGTLNQEPFASGPPQWISADGASPETFPDDFPHREPWTLPLPPSREWMVEAAAPRRIWNLTTRTMTGVLPELPGMGPPEVLPGGATVAALPPDQLIWHDATGREMRRATVPDWSAYAISASPDGRGILLAVSRRGLILVDGETGGVRWRAEAPQIMWPVTWSPDGSAFHLNDGGHSTLWDARTGTRRRVENGLPDISTAVFCFAGSPRLLVATDWGNTTFVTDVVRGVPLLRLPDGGMEPCFSAEQNLLGLHDWSRAGARVYQWHPQSVLHVLGGTQPSTTLAFTRDESRLASAEIDACRWWALEPVNDSAPIRTDVDPSRRLYTLLIHPVSSQPTHYPLQPGTMPESAQTHPAPAGVPVLRASQSADGRVRAFADLHGGHSVWMDGKRLPPPLASQPLIRQVAALAGLRFFCEHAAVSPDGSLMATADFTPDQKRRIVRLWRLNSDKEAPAAAHDFEFPGRWLAFSPDGRWLACGGVNATAVFDLTTMREAGQWPRRSAGTPGFVAFSADSALLLRQEALADLTLCRTGSWETILTLRSPSEESLGLPAFSPRGRWLAAAGARSEILLWDLHALRRELTARGLGWE